MSRFTRALVRRPTPNFADGLTSAALGAPDVALALAQHAAYVATLERLGLTIHALPPEPAHPDATFLEDTAVLAPRCAVLCRPGAPSRAGEVTAVAPALRAAFPGLLAIEPPGTVDGGDICDAGDHFFIGVSHRTNLAGARQLADLLGDAGYGSAFVDITATPGILHLKSGVAWLGGDRLLVIEALADHPAFETWERIVVPAGEEYAANAVLVNDRLLVASGFPRTAERLAGLGMALEPLAMSEFRKMDGGLSCLSLRW
ncbi:MAG: hypothetical protein NW201_00480 [Gemmatimonadales bacterium]|nr:hypothetical protein [Gemmatimonadales bacterium]